jgi:hypothetical protein
MYKVFTSLWSKLPPLPPVPSSPSTTTATSTQLTSDTAVDEDGWVLVSDIGLFIHFTVKLSFKFSSNFRLSIKSHFTK